MEETQTEERRIWQPGLPRDEFIENSEENLRTSEEEFEKAFEIIKNHPRRVTFFGSARTHPEDKYYQLAEHLATRLASLGYAIVSGGGGGIMAAANLGAKEANGTSIGFNIMLPHEQATNGFTTEHLQFHYFFTRKVMLTFYAHAYVFFPGGFGTLDEFFEVLTLMQTKKMARAPLILVGNEFWGNLDRFIHDNQLSKGTISPGDEQIYTIAENIDEVSNLISQAID